MKNSFIILLSIVSFSALGQTRQNINKNTGTVSNVLTTIDSIRFNGSSTTMEVVLQNGTVESHSISDIQNVNFISASQHSCGATNLHNPNLNYGSMTDQEGNVYKTIVIGTQEWMAENLKTSIYRNGDLIPNITDSIQWTNLSSGAWAFYNNDIQNECPYGKLYNAYTCLDTRQLCPTGWHVPYFGEWTTLIEYLGGPSVAWAKLKTTSNHYWITSEALDTNESGFSAIGGGLCDDEFTNFRNCGWWWSSSEFDILDVYTCSLCYSFPSVFFGPSLKLEGLSVRCLKD